MKSIGSLVRFSNKIFIIAILGIFYFLFIGLSSLILKIWELTKKKQNTWERSSPLGENFSSPY